jgi:hypothetical protein
MLGALMLHDTTPHPVQVRQQARDGLMPSKGASTQRGGQRWMALACVARSGACVCESALACECVCVCTDHWGQVCVQSMVGESFGGLSSSVRSRVCGCAGGDVALWGEAQCVLSVCA